VNAFSHNDKGLLSAGTAIQITLEPFKWLLSNNLI